MNVWLIVAIVGAVVKMFDKDWERMSKDKRWKLQNEVRKKNI